LPVKRSPSVADIGRPPRSRDRSRISVEPSVPAASTTMSAVIGTGGASNRSRPVSSSWQCTVHRPCSRSRYRTDTWVKMLAPWACASGR
jgi:hypothetical protein